MGYIGDYIRIMENKMDTTIICKVYVGITEKTIEAII